MSRIIAIKVKIFMMKMINMSLYSIYHNDTVLTFVSVAKNSDCNKKEEM